jgi:hypothetical protein
MERRNMGAGFWVRIMFGAFAAGVTLYAMLEF